MSSIQQAAFYYLNREEFQRENKLIYDEAEKLGILDEICSHMMIPTQADSSAANQTNSSVLGAATNSDVFIFISIIINIK